MKRLSLILLLCAAGCVNVEKPRAYRCQSSNDCVGPWVCLRDNYCHDPNLGVDVACESAADCVGGWFCAKDGRCRDPQKPSALVCDDDTQCATGWFCSREGVCRDRAVPAAFPCDVDAHCAGGWRCSTEQVCVDLSLEPQAPGDAALATTVRRSPLIPMVTRLHPSPPQYALDKAGEPLFLQQAALELADGGVALSGIVFGTGQEQVLVQHTLTPYPLPEPPVDVELNGPWVMTLDRAQRVTLMTQSGPLAIDAGAPVRSIKPMLLESPGNGSAQAFALLRTGRPGAVVYVPSTGEYIDVGKDVVTDVAYLDGIGSAARFAVVNAVDGDGVSIVETWQVDGTTRRLLTLQRNDGGVAEAVRAMGEWVAVLLEVSDGSAALQATYGVLAVNLSTTGMPRLGSPMSCPQGTLSEFAVTPAGALDIACLTSTEGGYVWRREAPLAQVSPLREFASRLVAGESGAMVRQTPAGALGFGGDLQEDISNVLDGHPFRLGVTRAGALAAVRGPALYLAEPPTGEALPQGLALAQFTPDAGAAHVATFIEGSEAWLWSNGLSIAPARDGGTGEYPWVFEGLPRLSRPLARVVPATGSAIFVAADEDTLWAAPVPDAGVSSVVRAVAKLAPGFDVTSWVAGPSDGGLVEGWATANNRLFKLSASTVERWKVTEVPVSGRDPLTVFFHGSAPRLGTTTGEVLTLPSRVQVAPALSEVVSSMVSVRGVVFASTDEGVFQLREDGGVAQWQPVPGTAALRKPLLQTFEARVFVTGENGVVLELE